MASSRGLGTLYSETNTIRVNNGLGQGCHGPGSIHSEQLGVNGLGQGPLHEVNYSSCNIHLTLPVVFGTCTFYKRGS